MIDFKAKTNCDHIVSNQRYVMQTCPRCMGHGFYYDISFDKQGQLNIVNKREKLSQEIIKIFTENKRVTGYGFRLAALIGSLGSEFQKARVKDEVNQAVMYLYSLQQNAIGKNKIFDPSEKIYGINKVEVIQNDVDPRIWHIIIDILLESGYNLPLGYTPLNYVITNDNTNVLPIPEPVPGGLQTFISGDIFGLVLRNTNAVNCYVWPNEDGTGVEVYPTPPGAITLGTIGRSFSSGDIYGAVLSNVLGNICFMWPNEDGLGTETYTTLSGSFTTADTINNFTSGNIIGLVLTNTNNTTCYVWPNEDGLGLETYTVEP